MSNPLEDDFGYTPDPFGGDEDENYGAFGEELSVGENAGDYLPPLQPDEQAKPDWVTKRSKSNYQEWVEE